MPHTIIRPRPFFSRQLPDDVKLTIVGGVGHWGSYKIACVCRDFRQNVNKARELMMYGVPYSVSAGIVHTVISTHGMVYTCGGYDPLVQRGREHHTVVWTDQGKAYSFGCGELGRLGHDSDDEDEWMPKLIEGVLVGKRVVGVAAGVYHTVVWTDEGKAYSFGYGKFGQLGHGGSQYVSRLAFDFTVWRSMDELSPRMIEGVKCERL